jgi:hypothetical protein
LYRLFFGELFFSPPGGRPYRPDDLRDDAPRIKMADFHLEFILNTYNATEKTILGSLKDFASALEVIKDENIASSAPYDFKINLQSDDPTIIFDICSQLGRIKSIKISEI